MIPGIVAGRPVIGGGGGGGDPYWGNVVSLLHFDGADGSTTFTDQTGKAWTATGATLSTAIAKYGSASGNFNSAARYIDATSGDFTFGTGDFTIELWLYRGGQTAGQILFDLRPASTSGLYPTIYLSSSTVRYYTNGADRISGGTAASSTWVHIALARSSSVTRLFVGGVQVGGDYSDANNYIGTRARVGNGGDNPISQPPGHIDELRITKGVARYTSNFTPPTAAFPNS